MFSAIIPTFNEEKNIVKTLENAKWLCPECEIIVIDAESNDNTIKFARKHATKIVKSKIKNRAHQLNLGAKYAKNDILIFLHADSILPKNWNKIVQDSIDNGSIWGGFFIKFNSRHPFFRFIEFRSNWIRATLFKTFFGDQGIFVRKDIFEKIHGFPEVPILEDVLISKKLKEIAKPKVIREVALETSARRFLKNGIYKTYISMGLVMLMYHLGFSLQTIKNTYKKLQ